MHLIALISTLASRNGHPCAQTDFTAWTAYPLQLQAVQTNGYDCGMWILAMILSVLQGYNSTSMVEADIEVLRTCISHLILQLEEK